MDNLSLDHIWDALAGVISGLLQRNRLPPGRRPGRQGVPAHI